MKKPVLAGLLVFAGLLTLTQIAAYQGYLLYKDAQARQLVNAANSAKERLQTALSYSLSATKTMSFIVAKYGIKQDFDEVAKRIMDNSKYIDALELVEQGTITNVYPLQGNESVIGYNIFSDSLRNKEALKAIEKKELYFAGPFKLKQGYVGIVGRLPIFVSDKFWGFSVVLIKLSTLIDAAEIDSNHQHDYIFQLSKINPDTHREEFFLPNPELFNSTSAVATNIANGDWKIYVLPVQGDILSSHLPFSLLGLILSITGGIFAWYISKQPIELKKMVTEQTAYVVREKNLSDSIINSMPGVFYLYDNTGRFIRWNKNFETITGYIADEVRQMHPTDFFEGPSRDLIKEKIEEVFTKGFADVETDFVTKDRRNIPYYFNGFSIDYQGKPSLIGSGIDITARKNVEREIIHEKNLSESIVNSLPGIFYLADVEGNLLRWNKNFETVSGYSAEEIPKMQIIDFVDFDEKEMMYAKREMVLQQGMADVEAGFLTKQKRKIPYHLTALAASYNDQPCLLGIGIDITERKKAQEEIRKSEEKYRYLFNNNPALIFVWDAETMKIMDVSEATMQVYGYTKEEFLSMDIFQLRPAEDVPRAREFAQMMLKGPLQKTRGTWRHLTKNREILYMDISSYRIDYNNRKAILSLAIDITDQYKAEEELRKTYDDIRRLNGHLQTIREEERAGIAREIHDELGQQLTGLKMDISWLSKKLAMDDEAIRLKTIEMIALIDNTVKTVRRISSDLRPGILDDLGLVAALEWQTSEFEKRTGITSKFTSHLKGPECDKNIATAIFRVYQEALTNVIRHAQATLLESNIEQSKEQILLTIKDNGKGFDIQEVKSKRTLGLLGMHERVLMFGGELKIESKPGQGCTITLKIPVTLSPQKNVV